jgi:DNA-binding CsgD family transcriptional regulator
VQGRSPGRRLTDLIGNTYAFQDLDEFRQGVLAELRAAVPADIASYNEVDDDPSRTWWASDPLLDLPPEMAETFARLAPQNPILAYSHRTRDGRPRRISDFLDRDAFHRLPLYREFYGPLGFEAQVALTLPSRPPVVIGIALTRKASDFTDVEVALLAAARPHLIEAYRRAELMAARTATIAALEAGLEAMGGAVLVADGHGRVEMATPAARRLLSGRLGGTGGRLSAEVVAELATRRAAATSPTEPLVLEGADGRRLTIRVFRGPENDTDMLVVEPGDSGLNAAALEGLGLTRREAEALRQIALGRPRSTVAAAMAIAPRTLEKHLQHAYAKLGVHSATEATATAWAAVGVRLPGGVG